MCDGGMMHHQSVQSFNGVQTGFTRNTSHSADTTK
jgi:hypothetical protein